MEKKFTKGEWRSTFNLSKERGVRSEGGFICFLPNPNRYSGQDQRYEDELEENKANAKLIAAAPDLLHECLQVISYLESFKDQWKEGEDIMWHGLQSAVKKALS